LVLSYLGLVSLLWELGRQTKAAEPFRESVELDPEDRALNDDLAWFLATSPEPRLRDAALAVRLARKAVTAGSESANFRNTLGVALYRLDWCLLAMARGHPGDGTGADLVRPRRAMDG
jgi:hypothetical protein